MDDRLIDEPLRLEALPLDGRILIEASAGTGKTYSLVRIVLRLLLEKELELPRILVMTFTRAATAELRIRLEALLQETSHAFERAQSGDRRAIEEDAVLRTIAARVSIDRAIALLRRARLDLDQSSIFTIHSFCQRVLTRESFATPQGPKREVSARSPHARLQAVMDFYRLNHQLPGFGLLIHLASTPQTFVQHYGHAIDQPIALAPIPEACDPTPLVSAFKREWASGERDRFRELFVDNRRTADTKKTWTCILESIDELAAVPFDELLAEFGENRGVAARILATDLIKESAKKTTKSCREALGLSPDSTRAECVPALIDALIALNDWRRNKTAGWLLRAIDDIRRRVDRQRDEFGQFTFDDLIVTLRDALQMDSDGVLAARLRASYPAALIDEFQDTDPLQFDILEAIYFRRSGGPESKATRRAPQAQSTVVRTDDDAITNGECDHSTSDSNSSNRHPDSNEKCDQSHLTSSDPNAPSERESVFLALIGDPKQAIYAFRGGDLPTYLRAAERVDRRYAMKTNYRSCAGVVAGYNTLFSTHDTTRSIATPSHRPSPLGAGIHCAPVDAGANLDEVLLDTGGADPGDATPDSNHAHQPPEESRQDSTKPQTEHTRSVKNSASFHWVVLPTLAAPGKTNRAPDVGRARTLCARWTAGEIHRLLHTARWIPAHACEREQAVQESAPRKVTPREIAILVRNWTEASPLINALDDLGIPVVYSSDRTSIFDTQEAETLEIALDGILHLERPGRLHRAAIGPLLSVDPVELARATTSSDTPSGPINASRNHQARGPFESSPIDCPDSNASSWDYSDWLDRIVALRERWRREGVLAMGLELVQRHARPPSARRERFLTNILHLLEILTEEPKANRSPDATLEFLRRARAGIEAATSDALEQRLESEADRVQIVTLHKSKGLEYPIVFLPFASIGKENRTTADIELRIERDTNGRRVLVPRAKDDTKDADLVAADEAENVRLLYVGATRAIHRLVLPITANTKLDVSLFGLLWKKRQGWQAAKSDGNPSAEQLRDWLIKLYEDPASEPGQRVEPAGISNDGRAGSDRQPDMTTPIDANVDDPNCDRSTRTASGLSRGQSSGARPSITRSPIRIDVVDPTRVERLAVDWPASVLSSPMPAPASLQDSTSPKDVPPDDEVLAARCFPATRVGIRSPISDPWRVHSFSAWTRGLHRLVPSVINLENPTSTRDHDALVEDVMDPSGAETSIDEALTRTVPIPSDVLRASPMALAHLDRLPMARVMLRGGAETGNFLHELLEQCDFPRMIRDPTQWRSIIDGLRPRHTHLVDTLLSHLDDTLRDTDRRNPLAPSVNQGLDGFSSWLDDVLNAPLPSGTTLGQLHKTHTLRECEFHFTIQTAAVQTVDFQTPGSPSFNQPHTAPITAPEQLLSIVCGHRARSASECGKREREALAASLPYALDGFLHGYIDLIYQHDGRFHIVDYKSSKLGEYFSDYTAERLTKDVCANAYDLQYLLYAVALHRHLKVRLGHTYAPHQHLGGVEYLYLRGIDRGGHYGIFHRPIDPQIILEIDELFSAGIT
ncbi:MAG: UvrD-helicase domain-containing protein [Thioalkalivibrionaceae bacterium]